MSTIMTANCLEYYALGILFYAVRQIATSVLVANLKQKLILKNTLISVILNILLNFVLIRHMGYKGLALSTSVTGFVAATLMLQDLRLLNLKLFVFEQIKDCFKIIGSSITATVFCSVLFNEIYALTVSNNLAIVVAIFLAVIAYVAISILLDIDIVIWLYKRIPQRLQFISKWNRKDKIYELS